MAKVFTHPAEKLYLLSTMKAPNFIVTDNLAYEQLSVNNVLEPVQITINAHASVSYMLAALGINVVPTMPMIYLVFASLVCSLYTKSLQISGRPSSDASID